MLQNILRLDSALFTKGICTKGELKHCKKGGASQLKAQT